MEGIEYHRYLCPQLLYYLRKNLNKQNIKHQSNPKSKNYTPLNKKMSEPCSMAAA